MKSIAVLRSEFFALKEEKRKLLSALREIGAQIMMKNFELQDAVYRPPGEKKSSGETPENYQVWLDRQKKTHANAGAFWRGKLKLLKDMAE